MDELVSSVTSHMDALLSHLDPHFLPHFGPYTLLAQFTTLFILFRTFVAWPLVTKVFRFDPSAFSSASASSSVVCLFHGGPVALASGYLCWREYSDLYDTGFGNVHDAGLSKDLAAFDHTFQQLAVKTLTFSCAYMVYDSMFMALNALVHGRDKEPYLTSFFLHHIGCVTFMGQVTAQGAGHLTLMLLIFLGEVTNPLQNTLNLAVHGVEQGRDEWRLVKSIVEPPFALFFALVRLVLGPPIVLYFFYHFIYLKLTSATPTSVPLGTGVFWCVVCAAMIHGSMGFAFDKLKCLEGSKWRGTGGREGGKKKD
jgi:hypothetical protein